MITPPPELVQQWFEESSLTGFDWPRKVAANAAQWAADQKEAECVQREQAAADRELEACCRHIRDYQWGFVDRADGTKMHRAVDLHQARRPKPQTLNSIALQMLGTIERDQHYLPEITDTIRRALLSIPSQP